MVQRRSSAIPHSLLVMLSHPVAIIDQSLCSRTVCALHSATVLSGRATDSKMMVQDGSICN